ncbi:MAG: YafY family transcriptional regulator [Rhodobacteraceae bacterium]|nr:YafY family transcriptional regulator [Paracoccaceae bacterium]
MRRADRLYRLTDLLRGGKLTTARRLADRLEVSERTIYRDIADLMASGVPIEGEAGVGYVMQPGFNVPPLMFDRSEVAALVTGARLVEAWGGAAMARAASEALLKIAAVVPEDIARAADSTAIQAFRTPDLVAADREQLDLLDAAIHDRTGLSLRYTDEAGAETARHVRPLGLVFWGKVWTLIAWCDLRDDFRMFRVDRITSAIAEGPISLAKHQTLAAFYAREVDCEDMRHLTGPRGAV